MVIEELIAKLGLRFTGAGEAKKFGREIDLLKKKMESLAGDRKVNFGNFNTGLARTIRDFDKAAAAAKRFRIEAERAGRVRPGRGAGLGPGSGFGPYPGRTVRPTKHPGGGHVAEAALAGGGVGVGRATVAGATAYGAGAVAMKAIRSSVDYERSMIEVQKATDATPEEREEYARKLTRIARDTGKNKEELAGMLSQAGFSGRPKDELMRFTEFGAKAAKAWGTTPEATGDTMAQLGNIYDGNQAEIERLADQVNTMADKSASKEVDLLEILRRNGQSAKTAGMSSGDVLAFGAGLKERGVQTEIAAGGIEDFINFLKLGSEYSTGAEAAIKQLGYTSKGLRKAFVKAPTETALGFLDKINAIKDPMKRAEILTGAFGKTRQDDVERLAGASKKIRENAAMINDPKNYKGSVEQQFQQQSDNDVSKMDQSSQQIDVMLERMGNPLKRFIGAISERFNKAADYIDDRTGNKTAAPSNPYDDLPGLDYLKNDPASPPPPVAKKPAAPSNVYDDLPGLDHLRGEATAAIAAQVKAILTPKFGDVGSRMGKTWGGQAGASPTFSPANFGMGGAQGPAQDWMRQSTKSEAAAITNNVTNNTDTGNDHRTQNVTINQTVSDNAAVAAAAAAGAKAGLASMGASIVKGNTASTGASTAP